MLCSHSSNDVPPEPQRNVSIAAVRGAVLSSKFVGITCLFSIFSLQEYRINLDKRPGSNKHPLFLFFENHVIVTCKNFCLLLWTLDVVVDVLLPKEQVLSCESWLTLQQTCEANNIFSLKVNPFLFTIYKSYFGSG